MKETEDGDKNIWSTLLSEVQANANVRHNTYGSVYGSGSGPQILILGSEQVGKTRLIASFKNSDEVNSGVGLEYHCLTFKEEQDNVTEMLQLGVWCLDGDPAHSNLMKFALNESNIWHTMLVVCVSLAEPWYMINELQMWIKIVQQHVTRMKLAPDELKALQSSVQTFITSYAEPAGKRNPSSSEENQEQVNVPQRPIQNSNCRRGSYFVVPGAEHTSKWPYTPLHPIAISSTTKSTETKTENREQIEQKPGSVNALGIPLLVVVTKVDYFDQLEKEFGFTDEHLDIIQYHLRKLCLKYQAGLIYTSTKEAINTDLLFRYLKHRLYDLPFSTTANLIEPTALFIPAGWDSEHRLEMLRKNLSESVVSDKFESNFPRPSKIRAKSMNKGKNCSTSDGLGRADDSFALQTVEDEQTFLARMQVQQQQMRTPSPGSMTPGDGSSLLKTGSDMNSPISSGSAASGISSGGVGITCTGVTPMSGSSSNLSEKEAVLSNFFNSLLTRKNLSETSPGGQSTPPVSSPKSPDTQTVPVKGSTSVKTIKTTAKAKRTAPEGTKPS